MVDIVRPDIRSRMMSGIRGKDTGPEMVIRRALHAKGYRFRLHRKDLPGKPDIVLPRYRLAIFIHGCFWHAHKGCRYFKLPSTRPEFWKEKLFANAERDALAVESLRSKGWRVLIIWECWIRNNHSSESDLGTMLCRHVEGCSSLSEISAEGGQAVSTRSSGTRT